MAAFTIRNATQDDFEQLHAFVFDKPDPNVLKRSREDVQRMIEAGVFFIGIDDNTRKIIASCYVKADSAEEFEFGGAYVDTKYRMHGIFVALGLAAIISHFLGQPDTPLIAHVVSRNSKPVKGLEKLKFKRTKVGERYHKSQLLGCEHMDLDAEGYLLGDTYEFQRNGLLELARVAEGFSGYVDGEAGRSRLTIDLPTFDKELLRSFRKSLEEE